jgi:hypothetical protein
MTTKQKFEEGLYDISIEAYHDAEGFSRTQLLAFNKSPYHFWYEHLSGIAEKKEPTDAMRMGSAIHTLLLQPELFKKEYAILPLLDRRTTKGKETYAAFMEENTGKIILSYEQYEKIISIITNVQRHEIVSNLLHGAQHEQSIFWTDKETGLQFKVRPDSWLGNMIVDLKTAKDSNIHRFKYTALSNGYYLQAGMIYEACKAIGKPIELFTLLVIEKDEPNVPSVFTMSDESLDFGVEQFNQYKRQLKKCMVKWSR